MGGRKLKHIFTAQVNVLCIIACILAVIMVLSINERNDKKDYRANIIEMIVREEEINKNQADEIAQLKSIAHNPVEDSHIKKLLAKMEELGKLLENNTNNIEENTKNSEKRFLEIEMKLENLTSN